MYKALFVLLAAAIFSCTPSQDSKRSLQEEISGVTPGDTLWIADGEYSDVEIEIAVDGREDAPIVLAAKTPGEVVFTGKSKIYFAASHTTLTGVRLENGHSPSGPAIVFQSKDKKRIPAYSRLTQCSIENYSIPERTKSDHWILLKGNHNRIDHNFIGTKLNLGTTVVVDLKDEQSQNNHHSIDSNYFAPKPRLGSNGGETLRVGASSQSLSPGNATIAYNYFDRCSGEVEIVSIKSSENTIHDNVFFESEGVLAMRHGNGNEVYGNYFLGNGKPNTGGVRVINADHKIYRNYFYGLTGERFFAALPVMNGVPNSPINRYHQVKNVEIFENTFIDCHQIAFGIGADNERTADPLGVSVSKNVFYQTQPNKTIEFLSGSSGVQFSDNVSNQSGYATIAGIEKSALELQEFDNGLMGIAGEETPVLPIEKSESGPIWKEKVEAEIKATAESRAPKKYILNQQNKTELLREVDQFAAGDTLWFEEAGTYEWNQPLPVSQDLFVYAKPGISHPQLVPGPQFKGKAFFEVHNGALLEVSGISFVGRSQHGDISTGICAMAPQLEHYVLKVYNCRFSEFNESRYAGITAEKGTFGDSLLVVGCDFKTFSGTGINLSTENGDRGRYNVEHLEIVDCNFKNIMGPAINIYRGGNDESTTGPYAWIHDCNFVNVCNRELGSVVRMIGVQQSEIYNCNFEESGKSGRVILFEDPAWAKVSIYDCNRYNSGRIQTFYSERVHGETITGASLDLQNKVATW
ncbi:MAG: hypothetical protein SchgKO_23540 [Schleiferiaceae bacterium]